MSNLVKQSQLRDIALDLWNKIKNRTNGAFKEVSYNETTQIITFTKIDNTTVTVDLTDLASETGDNFFTGINGFDDLYITSKDAYIHGGDLAYSNPAGGTKRVGRRDYTSHSNNNGGFVKSLFVRVSNSLGVGSTTNISVWEVKKKDTHTNDEPNQIINNVAFKVKEDTTWNRYIEVPINKEYDEETYFIFEVIPSSNLAYANVQEGNDNVIYIDNADVTGSNINNSKGSRYSCICALTGGTNIRKLITNAGTVKSVNNQQPDIDGNVTVGIDHIDNLRTELNDRVSQSQIGNQANHIPQIEANGKLATSIIPDLAITSVTTVDSKQAAMDLITAGTIQAGDVVVIDGEKNSVFMYNGGTGGNFDSDFIELSIGDGTVKTVNGQSPNSTGAVTIGISDISDLQAQLNSKVNTSQIGNEANKIPQIGANGKLDESIIPDSLKGKVATINNQSPDVNGNVNLSIETTNNNVNFKVGTTSFGTLAYMTQAEVDAIKDLFV